MDPFETSKILLAYDGEPQELAASEGADSPRDSPADCMKTLSTGSNPFATTLEMQTPGADRRGVENLLPPGTPPRARISFRNAAEIVKERYLKKMITNEKARTQVLTDKLCRQENESQEHIHALAFEVEQLKADMEQQRKEYEQTITAIRSSAQAAKAGEGRFAERPQVEKKVKPDLKAMIAGQMNLTRVKVLEKQLQDKDTDLIAANEKIAEMEAEKEKLTKELGSAQNGEGKVMNQLQQLQDKNDELAVKCKDLEDLMADMKRNAKETKQAEGQMREKLRHLQKDFAKATEFIPPPQLVDIEPEPLVMKYIAPEPVRVEVPVEVPTDAPPPPPPPPPRPPTPPETADAGSQTDSIAEEERDPIVQEVKEEVDEKKREVEQAILDHESELSELKRQKVQEAMEREAQLAAEDEVLELVNNIMKQAKTVAKNARITRMDVFARMEKMVREMQKKWRRRRMLVIDARKRELCQVLRIMNPFADEEEAPVEVPLQCTCSCICDKCSGVAPSAPSPAKSGEPGPLKYLPITKYSLSSQQPSTGSQLQQRSVIVPRSTYNTIPLYSQGVVPVRVVRDISSAPYSPTAAQRIQESRKQGFRLEMGVQGARSAGGGGGFSPSKAYNGRPTQAGPPQGYLAKQANEACASGGGMFHHITRQQVETVFNGRASQVGCPTLNAAGTALHQARLIQRPQRTTAEAALQYHVQTPPMDASIAPTTPCMQPSSSKSANGTALPNLTGRKIVHSMGVTAKQMRTPSPRHVPHV